MKQQREVLKKQKETADKIAARTFAQSYLADLVPSVFGTLSDNGYFYDPVERGKIILTVNFGTTNSLYVSAGLLGLRCHSVSDVEQGFMPWLMDRVCEEVQKTNLGRMVLDGMIREIVKARSQAYQVRESK